MRQNLYLSSLRLCLRHLLEQRSPSGGWGDHPSRPSEFLSASVFLPLEEMGLYETLELDKVVNWLTESLGPNPHWTYQWSGSLFYDETPEDMLHRNLLASAALLRRASAEWKTDVPFDDFAAAVRSWCQTVLADPAPFLARRSCWFLYIIAENLRLLGDPRDPLWNDLVSVIDKLPRTSDGLPFFEREDEAVKDAAFTMISLLRTPNIPDAELRSLADRLLGKCECHGEYAFWRLNDDISNRGCFHLTRWVQIALLESLEAGVLEREILTALEPSFRWLMWIQRDDGAWVEIRGDPLLEDDERNRRPTGPGFIAPVLWALGKWLFLREKNSSAVKDAVRKEASAVLAELRGQDESEIGRWPSPIATALSFERWVSGGQKRFSAGIYLYETCIKFLTVVVISDYLENAERNDSADSDIRRLVLEPGNKTTGLWLETLIALLQHIDPIEEGPFVARIAPLIVTGKKRTPTDLCTELREIKEIRNKSKGHDGQVCEDTYATLHQQVLAPVTGLLSELAFLRECRLLVVDEIRRTGSRRRRKTKAHSASLAYICRMLTGNSVIFPQEEITLTKGLELEQSATCPSDANRREFPPVLLDEKRGEAITLYPLLIFDGCPHCNLDETFFLEAVDLNKGMLTYHSYRGNHRREKSTEEILSEYRLESMLD